MEGERLESIASPVALGGISWGRMGGLLQHGHPGLHKGLSDKEINFWRWPKAGVQQLKEQGKRPAISWSFPVDLLTSAMPHVT